MRKSNVRKSNVRKSNVRKSNVRKSNVRKSNVRKSNVRKSNVRKNKHTFRIKSIYRHTELSKDSKKTVGKGLAAGLAAGLLISGAYYLYNSTIPKIGYIGNGDFISDGENVIKLGNIGGKIVRKSSAIFNLKDKKIRHSDENISSYEVFVINHINSEFQLTNYIINILRKNNAKKIILLVRDNEVIMNTLTFSQAITNGIVSDFKNEDIILLEDKKDEYDVKINGKIYKFIPKIQT